MKDEDMRKLYNFFFYSYTCKEVSQILNIPLKNVEDAYKSWLEIKEKLKRVVM